MAPLSTAVSQRALVTLADELGLRCELDETGFMVIYTDLTPSVTLAAGNEVTVTDLVWGESE
jgi:hypothetical protein